MRVREGAQYKAGGAEGEINNMLRKWALRWERIQNDLRPLQLKYREVWLTFISIVS